MAPQIPRHPEGKYPSGIHQKKGKTSDSRWEWDTISTKKVNLTLDARYGYGLANLSNAVARYNRMPNISLVVSK